MIGMTVIVEQVKWLHIERKQISMQQAVPSLVCQRGPYAALGDFRSFEIKRRRNHDAIDTLLTKLCISQDAVRKLFVLRYDTKALLHEAIDPHRLRGSWIKTLLAQFVRANPVDLARFEMRPFANMT